MDSEMDEIEALYFNPCFLGFLHKYISEISDTIEARFQSLFSWIFTLLVLDWSTLIYIFQSLFSWIFTGLCAECLVELLNFNPCFLGFLPINIISYKLSKFIKIFSGIINSCHHL